ncbi:MAG: chromosome segregation protein SMC, partial [Terriglobia bacterium]
RFHPLGLLADFLDVTPGYEEIVEEFLKDELDCVVVEGHEEARDGMALLRNEGAGRSAFFLRSFSSNGHTNALGDSGRNEARREQRVVACLDELVRFESRLNLNGSVALPVLSNSFLVEDGTAAERLAAKYPAYHFLTLKGEHYHHRLVSGGKGSSAGPLALRRDFRNLERRTTELLSALARAEENWAGTRSQLVSAEEESRRVLAEKLSAEKQSVLAGERLRQARDVVQQAAGRVRTLGHESATLAAERQEIGCSSDALRAALESARLEEQQSHLQASAAVESARALRAEMDDVSRRLAAEQVAAGALEERWRAADAERSRIAAEALASRERLGKLEMQIRSWQKDQRRLKVEAEDARQLLAQAELHQQELSAQFRAHEEESQRCRARRDEVQPEVEAARAALDSCREKKSEAEVILARAESDLGHHIHQCQEGLGAEPDSLRAEAAGNDLLEGELLQAAEQELRAIKDRIERLGPVNMMALEELREAEERLSFLETQRQDLLASISDTAQTIREIDEASRRKFVDAFKAINGFFAEAFRTLFGGGVGEMRQSDEADPESGIELVAQPPGKRLQNVLLLSGGEKALTALALLIAVFRFAPSPFCILDEVDAPLDESNVVRFTRLIEQMSEKTQFILITHNKRTMEVCRMMYGVTMEEPGVSKLVSVRFEANEREPVAVPA